MTASKKKKEKAKDFAKANFKLGKGKLKSANATDTSFSSRSIALTQQSITRDNAGVPTTKRNLTLEDLQTHLKHYSASTRKDALSGLRELLTAHPWLGESSVGSLVPLLARMIGDEEQSVRKALLAFLAWYLPGLPAIILQPHHSVLLFFATSAMSHIYPEIRMDAVRALNIMLDTFPESIALSWSGELNASRQANNEDDLPTKVLECYLSLLHIHSGITTNGLRTDMSPTAKALVLSSLATFLRLSTAPEGPTAAATRQDRALPDIPTWFMAPVFPTQRAYQSFVEQVASTSGARFSSLRTPNDQSCLIASEGLLRQERHLALSSISDIFTDITSIGLDSSNPQDLPSTPEQLLKTLLPILISAFLDSGPTAFSPEASAAPSTSTALEAATNTVIAVAEISRDLWRSVLLRNMHVMGSNQHAEIVSGLEKLVAHMAVYFPFGNDELLKRSSSDSSKLQSLNITFCELVALVGLGSQHQNNQQQAGGKVRKSRSKVDSAKASMSNYVESLLSSAKSSSILSSSTTVTPHMYSQLLPTIWSLLGASENSKEESNILETLVHHFLALAPISGVKKLAFKFIMRLLMLPDLCSAVKLLPCGQRIQRLKSNQLHEEFLLALPRYIWELSTKDEDFSRCILLYIQHALVVGTISVSTTEKLASYLSPYFMTQHPKKGSIPGPWTKLEEERSIIKALETAWWVRVGDIPAGSSTAFSAAVESAIKARASDQLSLYWSILASNES